VSAPALKRGAAYLAEDGTIKVFCDGGYRSCSVEDAAGLSAQLDGALTAAGVVTDRARLDSNLIALRTRDEFGQSHTVIHKGMDLRAAIDEARAYESGEEPKA
jgi:hypothetical protein